MKVSFVKLKPRLQTLEPGRRISGQYQIRKRIGEGVNGIVYLARDRYTHTDRVLKFPLNSDALQEMAWLAHKMIRLSHPHIVQHFGVGKAVFLRIAVPFMITEFVKGPSLADYHRQQPGRKIGLFEALTYFSDISQALAFAHSRGYAHEDIHDSNVLLAREPGIRRERQVAKLNDFFPTRKGRARLGKLADIRETGLILFHMLTGKPRYRVSAMRGIPPEIQDLIRRCVSSRNSRFTDARQVVQALKSLQWIP